MEPNPYESPREEGYEPWEQARDLPPSDQLLIAVVGLASILWTLWAIVACWPVRE